MTQRRNKKRSNKPKAKFSVGEVVVTKGSNWECSVLEIVAWSSHALLYKVKCLSNGITVLLSERHLKKLTKSEMKV
jgi:hypothetical protein